MMKDNDEIYYIPFSESKVKSVNIETLAVTDYGTATAYYFDISKDGRDIIYTNADDGWKLYKKRIGSVGVGELLVDQGFSIIPSVDRGYTTPPLPNQATIDGLECAIVRQPIISLTQWYSTYGSLPERIVTT